MRIAAAVLALILAGPVAADPVAEARAAAAALAAAGESLRGSSDAEDQIAALTETVRAYETGLSALRESLRRAAIRERVLERQFEADQARLADLLAVLQTLEGTPPQLLLIHPSGPIGSARAGMVLAELLPGLRDQAETLRAGLAELAALRAAQEDAEAQLTAGLAGVQEARSTLAAAVAERRGAPAFRADATLLEGLAQASRSLEAFATGLGALAPLPAQTAFAERRGALPWPVSGTLLRDFGAPDQAGIARPGWVIATAPGALVTAPSAASVRYAGPLLDYGNVIVLEPEPSYLLVLGGLSELFVAAGSIVDPEAPLGLMPADSGSAGGIGDGQIRRETLYLELREGRTPTDPAGWFRTDEG